MIKKILLIFGVMLTIVVNAQINVANDSVFTTHDTNVSEEDLVVHNTHSSSAPPTMVKWSLLSVEVPSTWENDAFICDAISCYDSATNFNEYELIDSRAQPLDVHFLNNQNTGEGKVKLLIWDINDSINTVKTVTYVVRVEQATSINDKVEDIDVDIFPNPVVKSIQVNNIDVSTITKIEIYNIIGRKVYQSESVLKNNSINIEALNKGVYVIKLLDQSNKHFYTKNFIKK